MSNSDVDGITRQATPNHGGDNESAPDGHLKEPSEEPGQAPGQAWGGPSPDSAPSQQVTIVNARGLHARAARKFVELGRSFEAQITISLDAQSVDADSIMEVLMLAAPKGATIQIEAKGPDAQTALAQLVALVEEGFGEI